MQQITHSLQYNVSQLLKSDVGDKRSYDFESDETLDLDGAVAHTIAGHVKFTLTNYGILASVAASAQLDQTCARCLEPFEGSTDVQFEEEYRPSIDITSGLPSEGPPSDVAFSISPNHTIDLREALRQHLLLALEIVPVCRPDCLGLCPSCGVNLNRGRCSCHTEEEANPFAVLQELLLPSQSPDQ